METVNQNFIIMIKQFVLIFIICTLGTAISAIIQFLLDNRLDLGYYEINFILGPLWAFLVFRVFKQFFTNAKMIAIIVSFNEVFALEASHYLSGTSLFFFSIFLLINFIVFLAPTLFMFRVFKGVFEVNHP